ncbi:hypothetical protein E2562_001955 [Oryza meyeriana var. granulata]|uniref:Uncharacterized protein n=1 Tax=Oryza meyeriana var. granulata TaxID=110450 RepID=A0A6G1C3C1_9ORYZ|nr:hypothetical protein E2562_001955 [Oryza meyeriana var. granulata]
MLHFRSRLLPLLRATCYASVSAFSSPLHLCHLLSPATTSAASSSHLHLSCRLLSTATSSATTTPFSVEDYLVASCGLTGAQALKASKKLSHLKSATKPDAVFALLSGGGPREGTKGDGEEAEVARRQSRR